MNANSLILAAASNHSIFHLTPSEHNTLTQCWANVGPRLRRWANICLALTQRVVFAGMEIAVGAKVHWYQANVTDVGQIFEHCAVDMAFCWVRAQQTV